MLWKHLSRYYSTFLASKRIEKVAVSWTSSCSPYHIIGQSFEPGYIITVRLQMAISRSLQDTKQRIKMSAAKLHR